MSIHFTNTFITNTTGAPTYLKLKDTILDTMTWKPVVHMKGCILPSGNVSQVHNICHYMGPTANERSLFPDAFPRLETSFMFDPTIYNGPQAFDALKKDIISSFKDAGFKGCATKHSYRGNTKSSTSSRQARIEFMCNCGKESLPELEKKGCVVKYRTSRASRIDSKCTFRLQVACASNNQWYIIHGGDHSGK